MQLHYGKIMSYYFLEHLCWILSIQSGDIPASAAARIKLEFSLLVSVILGCNSYCVEHYSVWKTANCMGGGGAMKQVKHSLAFLVRAGSTNQNAPVREPKTWPLSSFVDPSFMLVHAPIKRAVWYCILFNIHIKWMVMWCQPQWRTGRNGEL